MIIPFRKIVLVPKKVDINDCPYFFINRMGLCSCKEYTKGDNSLVLVDENCLTHGNEKEVDARSQNWQSDFSSLLGVPPFKHNP